MKTELTKAWIIVGLLSIANACTPPATDAELKQMCDHLAVLRSGGTIKTDQKKYRPASVIHYPELFRGRPDFAVDISEEWEVKLESIKAHQSQVYDEKFESDLAVKTVIKSKDFWELIDAKFRYYGGMAGVKYAEVFYIDGIPRLTDLVSAFTRKLR